MIGCGQAPVRTNLCSYTCFTCNSNTYHFLDYFTPVGLKIFKQYTCPLSCDLYFFSINHVFMILLVFFCILYYFTFIFFYYGFYYIPLLKYTIFFSF